MRSQRSSGQATSGTVHHVETPMSTILQVSFLSNSRAASAGTDGIVCLWDINKHSLISKMEHMEEHGWVGSFNVQKDMVVSGHQVNTSANLASSLS